MSANFTTAWRRADPVTLPTTPRDPVPKPLKLARVRVVRAAFWFAGCVPKVGEVLEVPSDEAAMLEALHKVEKV